MITLKIYIYTNNIDLHCVSAFETIKTRNICPFINSLERYRQCVLTFNVTTVHDAKIALSELISSSYDLLNPNKESYYIETIPTIKSSYSHVIEVSHQDSNDDHQLCQRLKMNYSTNPLQNLTQSIVWHFLCNQPLAQTNIDELHSHVILSSTRLKGLLVNPLFESVRICELDNTPSLSS